MDLGWCANPQWWSVIVSGGTMLVTFGTLAALWSQINAVRRTERAIFIPIWEQETWVGPEAINAELSHSFQWSFKNEGKTAGFLRGTYAEMLLLESLNDLPERPAFPRKHVVSYQGDPITSGSKMERNST